MSPHPASKKREQKSIISKRLYNKTIKYIIDPIQYLLHCMSIWRCFTIWKVHGEDETIRDHLVDILYNEALRIKRTRLNIFGLWRPKHNHLHSRSYSQGYIWKFPRKNKKEYLYLKPIHLISSGCHQCKLGKYSLQTRRSAQGVMASLLCQGIWFHVVQTTSPHNINQGLSINYQQRHNAYVTCPEKPISHR